MLKGGRAVKKTLSLLALLGMVAVIGSQSASAFDWSNLNPAYWGHCPKCEKKKKDCGCKNAILLDGGGSQFVGQVVNGKVKHLDNNNQNRPVSTWFLIYLKKDKVVTLSFYISSSSG